MRFAGSPQIASFLHSKLDFGDTAQAGQKSNAEQRIMATQADAAVEGANIKGDAMIKAAELGADATRAQGAAAGQASMFGGISSGISSLAGGIFGGTNSDGQTGIDRNFSGLDTSKDFGFGANNWNSIGTGSYPSTYNIWNR